MLHKFMSIDPVRLALYATIMTWLFTLLGSAVVIFFKKVNKTVMDSMLGVASGVMIAASFWSLLEPGIERAALKGQIPWLIASLGFISGTLLIILSDKIVNKVTKKFDNARKSKLNRILMLIISITVHNIPEGLAVGLAFGGLKGNLTEPLLMGAFLFALGIGIQNFPEGAAVSLKCTKL